MTDVLGSTADEWETLDNIGSEDADSDSSEEPMEVETVKKSLKKSSKNGSGKRKGTLAKEPKAPKTSNGNKSSTKKKAKKVSEYSSSSTSSASSDSEEEGALLSDSEGSDEEDTSSSTKRTKKERKYFVDETTSEDLASSKASFTYYNKQDTFSGLGFRTNEEGKKIPKPLIDTFGAKRLAVGGTPFVKPATIGHLKDRAGIVSAQRGALALVARLAEEATVAITGQSINNCKALGRKTIMSGDVRNASNDMGISHFRT